MTAAKDAPAGTEAASCRTREYLAQAKERALEKAKESKYFGRIAERLERSHDGEGGSSGMEGADSRPSRFAVFQWIPSREQCLDWIIDANQRRKARVRKLLHKGLRKVARDFYEKHSTAVHACVGLAVGYALYRVYRCYRVRRLLLPESRLRDNQVYLYGYPRTSFGPSTSPFCTKVEVFLRLAKIPYVYVPVDTADVSPTGRLPMVWVNDEVLTESSLIVKRLEEIFHVDLARGFLFDPKSMHSSPLKRAPNAVSQQQLGEGVTVSFELQLLQQMRTRHQLEQSSPPGSGGSPATPSSPCSSPAGEDTSQQEFRAAAGLVLERCVETDLWFLAMRTLCVENTNHFLRHAHDVLVGGYPLLTFSIFAFVFRRRMIHLLNLQGTGDLQARHCHALIAADIASIEQFLSSKQYILSNSRPSTVDCTVFSFLHFFRGISFALTATSSTSRSCESSFQVLLRSATLEAYLKRMEDLVFPDLAGLVRQRNEMTPQAFNGAVY
jgi:glutathione S-transferase